MDNDLTTKIAEAAPVSDGEILIKGDMRYASEAFELARKEWSGLRRDAVGVGFGWGYSSSLIRGVSFFLRKTKRGVSIQVYSRQAHEAAQKEGLPG